MCGLSERGCGKTGSECGAVCTLPVGVCDSGPVSCCSHASHPTRPADPSPTVAFCSAKERPFAEQKATLGSVLPHNLCVGIPDIDGDALLVRLQQSDLCVSSGAACSSTNREPSHVLTAIGVPERLARASVRFGLGRTTTAEEVSKAVAILGVIVEELRAIGLQL